MPSSGKVVPIGSLKISIPECAVCKRTIMKGFAKCNICNKVYHPSCSNRVKKCCDEEIMLSSDCTPGSVSPITEAVNKKITNESTQLELLLKIIHELEEKNTLLIENNRLLKFKISTLEVEITNKNAEIDTIKKKNNNKTNTKSTKTVEFIPPVQSNTAERETATGSATVALTVPDIVAYATTSGAPEGIVCGRNDPSDNNTTRLKEDNTAVNSYKSSIDNNTTKNPSNSQSEEWSTVSHKRSIRKRSRALVVGSCSGNSSVEGNEKFSIFHVTNLKPETTAENLQDFLKSNFSSVRCEKLTSRYPENYSSFKVTIPSSDYEKALDGSNWPIRASIHRFFRPRKINRPTD